MKTLNIVQQEYKMLDVMKFVMAIVVVAIHTRPELSFKSTFIRELFEALSRFSSWPLGSFFFER